MLHPPTSLAAPAEPGPRPSSLLCCLAGAPEGFFSTLVDVVVANMGHAYPELGRRQASIKEIIRDEEASFSRTLMKARWVEMEGCGKGGAGGWAPPLWAGAARAESLAWRTPGPGLQASGSMCTRQDTGMQPPPTH